MLRGRCDSLTVLIRAIKLGVHEHWWLAGAMRAFRRWALIIDLRAAYDAAFGFAAHIVTRGADGLTRSLEEATQQTVQVRPAQSKLSCSQPRSEYVSPEGGEGPFCSCRRCYWSRRCSDLWASFGLNYMQHRPKPTLSEDSLLN